MNVLVCSILLIITGAGAGDTPRVSKKKFPNDFKWSVGTSAYQIEGAWNEDGKGENIWDHQALYGPYRIENNDTGFVACDSYHKYKEDIKILKELGVSYYRFSFSWSRILPNGLDNVINQAGINYYKNLICQLKANNIEPVVTLFHWDTPQKLEDKSGFASSKMVKWFADYARLCFQIFGKSVKYWFTFNEPKQTCYQGYGTGDKAPFISSPGVDEYKCTHNLIKAHAAAWHIYDKEFRKTQKGKLGIVLDCNWMEPANNTDPSDVEAAETKRQFIFGLYANPVFYGDYPQIVKENIARRSIIQNYEKSRLPEFTDKEKKSIKGTVDILGFNSYTTEIITPAKPLDLTGRGLDADAEVKSSQLPSWPSSGSSWLKVVPWGMRKILEWIDKTYGNPVIFITENGVSDRNGTLQDDFRIKYYQDYLTSVQEAMNSGVKVIGYTAWSLMDNFEWTTGYSERFGLYHVDFNNPARPRLAKDSAKFYKRLTKTNCLVEVCQKK